MRTNANALTGEINVLMYEEERLDYVLEIAKDGNGKNTFTVTQVYCANYFTGMFRHL